MHVIVVILALVVAIPLMLVLVPFQSLAAATGINSNWLALGAVVALIWLFMKAKK